MPENRVVKITIEYSNGLIEGASGDRAHIIWSYIVRSLMFCSIHGSHYSGPRFDVIVPGRDESTQNVLGG
jgi:hypothetical protein